MEKNTAGRTSRISAYGAIDVVKLLMAFCVVAIHTHPFENCNNEVILTIYNSVIELAVPFFFLASGFFLAQKMNWPYGGADDMEKVKSYLIKILKMYLIWSVIYFPLALIEYIPSGKSFLKCCILYIRGLILVGEHYNSWICGTFCPLYMH